MMRAWMGDKDKVGFCAAIALSLAAGVHWLQALCYSRGYDFFLWLYNAWLLQEGGASGEWPDWSSYAASGQPAFKMAGLSDALIYAPFLKVAGLEWGSRIYACSLYVLAGTGMYRLARMATRSPLGGVVASVAYTFSWFITYTAYYQSYLSNFLSYALMPWCSLFFIYALCAKSRGYLLATAVLVFISVTSNAQVSIKMMLFALPVAGIYTVLGTEVKWSRWAAYSVLVCCFALWWSAFLIVPALALRDEVLLLGTQRANAFVGPLSVLFGIPLYGLNFLCYRIAGFSFLDRADLAAAIFTDYVGLSVLLASVLSWGYFRRYRDPRIQALFGLLLGYWFLYFAVVPQLAASAWVGRTHNWAILPTLVLALLSGYGAVWLAEHWRRRFSVLQMGLLFCGAIMLDLAPISYFLNKLAMTHTPLRELPEVVVWKKLAAQDDEWRDSGRYFTFNPDHTFYLLPILVGKPTANIIELRTRNWEYNSYIAHQLQSMRQLDLTYNPSESLALLNVDYVDFARKLYAYRGDHGRFEEGLALLVNDENLNIVARRAQEVDDRMYDYTSTLKMADLVGAAATEPLTSQAVFYNARHLWGAIPEGAVLLLGDTHEAEKIFEKITHLPGYRADRLLFILSEQVQSWPDKMQGELKAVLAIGDAKWSGSTPQWNLQSLADYYQTPLQHNLQRPTLIDRGAEQIVFEVPAISRGMFLFLSQQFFQSWRAYDQSGNALKAVKAGAGLTAIYLPPATRSVQYRYEVPGAEMAARLFSLLGIALALLWWWKGGGNTGGEETAGSERRDIAYRAGTHCA
jgi:hypothetical protein